MSPLLKARLSDLYCRFGLKKILLTVILISFFIFVAFLNLRNAQTVLEFRLQTIDIALKKAPSMQRRQKITEVCYLFY